MENDVKMQFVQVQVSLHMDISNDLLSNYDFQNMQLKYC